MKVNLESICTKLTNFHLNHTIDKIRIVNTYVYSKIKWEFRYNELSTTWVKQHLDIILTCRIRYWVNHHPGANSGQLKQSTSKLGINLSFLSENFLSYQTTTRRILSQSKDPDVLKIYNDTKNSILTPIPLLKEPIAPLLKIKTKDAKKSLSKKKISYGVILST